MTTATTESGPQTTSTPGPTPRSLRTRLSLLVGLLVFGVCAYFYHGAMDNQNARLNAIWTFVEPGPHQFTFRMDPFMQVPESGLNTVDWSYFDGHYYANKAPGVMILGVLIYWPLYHLERICGMVPEAPPLSYCNAYLINVWVSVLPLAIAAALFCLLVVDLGLVEPERGLFLTIAVICGTMLLTHSTQLWGHTTAAACWFAVLVCASRESPKAWGGAGFFAGAAVLMEYMSALMVIVFLAGLGASAVVAQRQLGHCRSSARPWRNLLAFCLGGAPVLLVFVLYHRLVFGGWLVTATRYQNPDFSDPGRLMGIFGWPQLSALWGLSLSPAGGLFFICPLLLLAPVGFWYWRRRRERLMLLRLAVASVLLMFVAISAHNNWTGCATFGPRYLIAIIPFLGLALAWLPHAAGWRWIFRVLASVSMFIMLAVVCVSPTGASGPYTNPTLNELHNFAKQNYSPYLGKPIRNDWVYFVRDERPPPNGADRFLAFNLGNFYNLFGHRSLLPLAIYVLVVTAAATRTARCLAAAAGRSSDHLAP